MKTASFCLERAYEIDGSSKHSTSIVDPSSKQSKLSEDILTPNIEDIELFLYEVREAVDEEIGYPENYPIGECFHIVQKALSVIAEDNRVPGLGEKAITNFMESGGTLRQVWGAYDDRCFQNMIQAGDYFFDIANDTIEGVDVPVVIRTVKSATYKNVDTIDKFIEIAEKYWEVDVYPNVYFPEIAPTHPLILVYKDGRTDLNSSILELNIKSGFIQAQEFFDQHPYKEKRLNSDQLKFLEGAPNYRSDTNPEVINKWVRHFVDNASVKTNEGDIFVDAVDELVTIYHESNESRNEVQKHLLDKFNE